MAQAEEECNAANVEENDYTIFTVADLEFELELVVQSVSKKLTFIDNQVCVALLSLCLSAHPWPDRLEKHDKPHTRSTGGVREHVPLL